MPNRLTRLALTSCVWFSGSWQEPFPEEETADAAFHRQDGSIVTVPFMHDNKNAWFGTDGKSVRLRLPYIGGASMLLIMPTGTQTLADLEKNLCADSLEEWTGNMEECDIVIDLPKWRQENWALDAADILRQLGMPTALDENADFSRITDTDETFCIHGLVHKTFIAVDETGTEATAATLIDMGRALRYWLAVGAAAACPRTGRKPRS